MELVRFVVRKLVNKNVEYEYCFFLCRQNPQTQNMGNEKKKQLAS